MNQKFPYILRISEKAKRVRFQVSAEKGLEIVVPKRFSARRGCHRWSRRTPVDRTDFPKGEGLPRTDRSGCGLADAGRDYVACPRPDVEGAYLPGQHEVGGYARNFGHNSYNARRNR